MSREVVGAWLILANVALVGAGQAPGAGAGRADGVGVVLVRVMDAQTRAPIPRAIVVLTSPAPGTTARQLSDDLGRVLFKGLVPGTHRIGVSAPGYIDKPDPLDGPGYTVPAVVSASDAVQAVDVFLVRFAAIRGRITDDQGTARPGVSVVALKLEDRRGEFRVPSQRIAAVSNDRGDYVLTGIRPGAYVIGSVLQNLGVRAGHSIVLPAVYYPAADSLADAQFLTLAPGVDMSGIDLRVRTTTAVNVTGRVTGMGPTRDLPLRLIPATQAGSVMPDLASDRPSTSVRTDAAGMFVFHGVAPGHYMLSGMRPAGIDSADSPTSLSWVRQRIDIAEADVDLVAELHTGVSVRGRVVLDAAASRSAPAARESWRVSAEPLAGAELWLNVASVQAGLAADGTFELGPMVPGRYLFRVTGQRGMVISGIRQGSRTRVAGPIDVDANSDGIELIVADRVGGVDATVPTANEHPMGVDVVVFPRGSSEWDLAAQDTLRFKRIGVPATGRVMLPSLLPGDYVVAAFPRYSIPGPWTAAATLRGLAASGTVITVTGGGDSTVRLRVVAIQ